MWWEESWHPTEDLTQCMHPDSLRKILGTLKTLLSDLADVTTADCHGCSNAVLPMCLHCVRMSVCHCVHSL